jgi:hypothetical protein
VKKIARPGGQAAAVASGNTDDNTERLQFQDRSVKNRLLKFVKCFENSILKPESKVVRQACKAP